MSIATESIVQGGFSELKGDIVSWWYATEGGKSE